MAYPLHKIGSYTFTLMLGTPGNYQREIARIRRPNVDGEAHRKLGQVGNPFQITTTLDVLNSTSATTAIGLYENLVGADSVNFVWNNHDYETINNLLVDVLQVRTAEIKRFIGLAGRRDNPFSQVRLGVAWTLQFRPA